MLSFLRRENTFRQAIIILFVVDNISKLINFLKNILIASLLGFSRITDAFNYANTIITTTLGLFSDSMRVGVIPFLHSKVGEQERKDFVYSVYIVALLLFLVLSTLYFAFFSNIIKTIAPGFSEYERSLVYEFSFYVLGASIFLLFIRVVDGYFRAEMVFGVSSITRLAANLSVILILFFFLAKSYKAIAIAPFVGNGIGFLLFLIIFKAKFKSFDKDVFKLLKFSIPLILGAGIGTLNNFVDRGFATTLPEGHLTALTYAFLIANQVKALFVGPIEGASFTFISNEINEGKSTELQERIDGIVNGFTAIYALVCVLTVVFGFPVLKLLFLHGKVTIANIILTNKILLIYFPIVLFTSVGNIIVQIYFSHKQTVVPTFITMCFISLNILMNVLLVKRYGAYALASSTLVTSAGAVTVSSLYIRLKYRIITFRPKHLIVNALVALIMLNASIFNYYRSVVYGIGVVLFISALLLLLRILDLKLLKRTFLRR